jgi:hypothetical protein
MVEMSPILIFASSRERFYLPPFVRLLCLVEFRRCDPPYAFGAIGKLLRLWRCGADFVAFPCTKSWYGKLYPNIATFP